MSAYLWLRFFKFVGVAVFFAGTVGTFSAVELDVRRRWAELHAAPGYILTWVCGLGLASATGQNPAQRWVLLAIIASTASLFATLGQAHLLETKSRPLAMLASLGFVSALASMVWKP
jgi:hypothetical protein